ncbi:TolC family protein [Ferruginibacter profundus]
MKQGVVFIFLLTTVFYTQAQGVLKLPDAVNISLKNSLDLQLSKNTLEANSIFNNYGVAGGLPLVTANLSDNEQVSNINQKLNTGTQIQRNGASTNALVVGVTGSILLYNGNRVVAAKSRLAQLEKQSRLQLNSRIQNIMADVMTGYYDIVRQQSYMKTIDRSIDIAQQKLSIVQIRQSVGLANNADLFQAQSDLNALLQAKQSQQVIVDQAKTELLRQLTLKADSTIAIEDTIIVDRSVNLDVILNSLNKNADILAAADQVKINEFIVKETAALRYPSIRATTGFNFSRNQAAAGQVLLNQNYGPSVGISVGIPIYNGSVYKRQQQVAALNVKNAGIAKDILMRDYSAQVVKSYQSYASALKQLQTEEQNYDISLKLVDVVFKRFQAKIATIVDLKNAQQSFEESGYRLVNLNYAAKAAEIELKRLANILSL